jgi:hypothetical protein
MALTIIRDAAVKPLEKHEQKLLFEYVWWLGVDTVCRQITLDERVVARAVCGQALKPFQRHILQGFIAREVPK